MKIVHTEDVVNIRKEAYPSVGDQLDEIWKILDSMKVKSPVLDAIKAVKGKYPKAGEKT